MASFKGGIVRIVRLVLDKASAKAAEKAMADAIAKGTDGKKAKKNLSLVDQAFGKLKKAAIALGGAILAAFAIRQIARFASSIVSATATMDGLRLGMKAVSGSAADANAEIAKLQEVAKLPGLGFEQAITGSLRLQSAGASAEQARKSLMAFGNAVATAGGGKRELDGVTIALSQILTAGRVLGQEIRQLNQRVPQIRSAMIAAFGTSRSDEIQALNISADEFVDTINDILLKLPILESGFKNTLENMGDQWFRLRVAAGESFFQLAGGQEVLELLIRIMIRMTESIQRNRAGWRSLGTILKAVLATAEFLWIMFTSLASVMAGTMLTVIGSVNNSLATLNDLMAGTIEGMALWLDLIPGLGEVADKFDEFAAGLRDTARAQREVGAAAGEAGLNLIREGLGLDEKGGVSREQLLTPEEREPTKFPPKVRTPDPFGLEVSKENFDILTKKLDALTQKAAQLKIDMGLERDIAKFDKMKSELALVEQAAIDAGEAIRLQVLGGASITGPATGLTDLGAEREGQFEDLLRGLGFAQEGDKDQSIRPELSNSILAAAGAARMAEDQFAESAQTMENAMLNAALSISDAFALTFRLLFSGAGGLEKAFAGIGLGIVAGLSGGMAQYHEAEGLGKLATGTWPPNALAIKSAAGHFLAAGAFRALESFVGEKQASLAKGAGVNPAIGGAAASAAAFPGQQGTTEINIFMDPFNPDNPLHQRQIFRGTQLARERFGDQIPIRLITNSGAQA